MHECMNSKARVGTRVTDVESCNTRYLNACQATVDVDHTTAGSGGGGESSVLTVGGPGGGDAMKINGFPANIFHC